MMIPSSGGLPIIAEAAGRCNERRRACAGKPLDNQPAALALRVHRHPRPALPPALLGSGTGTGTPHARDVARLDGCFGVVPVRRRCLAGELARGGVGLARLWPDRAPASRLLLVSRLPGGPRTRAR